MSVALMNCSDTPALNTCVFLHSLPPVEGVVPKPCLWRTGDEKKQKQSHSQGRERPCAFAPPPPQFLEATNREGAGRGAASAHRTVTMHVKRCQMLPQR